MSKGDKDYKGFKREVTISTLKAFPGYLLKETIILPYTVPKFGFDVIKGRLISLKKSFLTNKNLSFKQKLKAIFNKELRKYPKLMQSIKERLNKLKTIHDKINKQMTLSDKEFGMVTELELEMNEYIDFVQSDYNSEFNEKLIEIDEKLHVLSTETDKFRQISEERYMNTPEFAEERLASLEPEINFCLKYEYAALLKEFAQNPSIELQNKIAQFKEKIALSDGKLHKNEAYVKDKILEYMERKNNHFEYRLDDCVKQDLNIQCQHKSSVFSEHPRYESIINNTYSKITSSPSFAKSSLDIHIPSNNNIIKDISSRKDVDHSKVDKKNKDLNIEHIDDINKKNFSNRDR